MNARTLVGCGIAMVFLAALFLPFFLEASADSAASARANPIVNIGSAQTGRVDDGSACWNLISSPSPGTGPGLFAVTGSGSDFWAVGQYGFSGRNQTLTLHWNGSEWSHVPSPNLGTSFNFLSAITGSGDDVWAVGGWGVGGAALTLTLHWDGSAWLAVASPNPGGGNVLYGVAGSGNDVWAVGYFAAGGPTQTMTLHWDGNAWSQVASPNVGTGGNFLYAVAGGGNDVWAVGTYYISANSYQTLTLHWNGSAWSQVTSPSYIPTAVLYGVSGSGNDVWAVGRSDSGDFSKALTLHWDGSVWTLVASPSPGAGTVLYGVTNNGSDVWAVGSYGNAGSSQTLTLHWDGNEWFQVASPNAGATDIDNNGLNAISGSGNNIWAVGLHRNDIASQTLTLHRTSPCSLMPVRALSRKIHGGARTYDVDLPLTGTPGIECRSGGNTSDYEMVVILSNLVTVNGNPQAQVTAGIGEVGSGGVSNGGMVSVSGNIVSVPLTNVANAQTINLTLFGVNNGSSSGNVVIPMSVLVGDTNANSIVNATDVSQTKSQAGFAVTGLNFREDANVSNSINATDVSTVKLKSGTGLPP